MSQQQIVRQKLAFETTNDRGFTARATYLFEPEGDALIEIFRDGEPLRWFLFPAYKIYNIAAHFGDIVDSELAGNKQGYDMAAWTGFTVIPTICPRGADQVSPNPQLEGPRKFRKKPIVIEAIQFTGSYASYVAVCQFLGIQADAERNLPILINTREGHLTSLNDWIIRGVVGEFYPCKPEIFEATYEPAARLRPLVKKEKLHGGSDLSKLWWKDSWRGV